MRERMQGERRANRDAREDRFEVYTCVHVRCACATACGGFITYVRLAVRRHCGGFCWREGAAEGTPARQANITGGPGVTLLLWQICELISHHRKDIQKLISRVPGPACRFSLRSELSSSVFHVL